MASCLTGILQTLRVSQGAIAAVGAIGNWAEAQISGSQSPGDNNNNLGPAAKLMKEVRALCSMAIRDGPAAGQRLILVAHELLGGDTALMEVPFPHGITQARGR